MGAQAGGCSRLSLASPSCGLGRFCPEPSQLGSSPALPTMPPARTAVSSYLFSHLLSVPQENERADSSAPRLPFLLAPPPRAPEFPLCHLPESSWAWCPRSLSSAWAGEGGRPRPTPTRFALLPLPCPSSLCLATSLSLPAFRTSPRSGASCICLCFIPGTGRGWRMGVWASVEASPRVKVSPGQVLGLGFPPRPSRTGRVTLGSPGLLLHPYSAHQVDPLA